MADSDTTDDETTDSQPDRSELETARAIVDEAIGRGISRRAIMLAAAAGVSGAALGTLGGRASAASPSDASGTVYFEQIGDSSNPVQDLFVSNQIVSDTQTSISTDQIDDNGSGSVSLLSLLDAQQNGIAGGDYSEAAPTQSGSGSFTLDLQTANAHRIEATGDVSLSFSGVSSSPPGNQLLVYLTDSNGSGAHTISWPSSVQWAGGSATTEIPASSNVEVALFSDDGGSTWRARESGRDFQ